MRANLYQDGVRIGQVFECGDTRAGDRGMVVQLVL